ncbi:MAG: HPr kinase/phosphatase C-terminal domain-containing protein [Pseudomonadota bacterium]
MSIRLHATTIAIAGRGVMLTGPSGSGKSDLALRLIDRGAALVADDQTILVKDGDALRAQAVPGFEGKLEVRGLGIVDVTAAGPTAVALELDLSKDVPRLPEPATRTYLGANIPWMALDGRPASAPMIVELAVARLGETDPSSLHMV